MSKSTDLEEGFNSEDISKFLEPLCDPALSETSIIQKESEVQY